LAQGVKKEYMKNRVILIFALALMVSALSSQAGTAPSKYDVKVISTKRYIFYFKVDKRLIGANVQILDENQKEVSSEMVLRSRMILDFFFLRPGNYTVRISKDGAAVSFPYANQE
jgi:hypothetical protein